MNNTNKSQNGSHKNINGSLNGVNGYLNPKAKVEDIENELLEDTLTLVQKWSTSGSTVVQK
eukprot:10935080-Heterocapsa_arctica.AAC.1